MEPWTSSTETTHRTGQRLAPAIRKGLSLLSALTPSMRLLQPPTRARASSAASIPGPPQPVMLLLSFKSIDFGNGHTQQA